MILLSLCAFLISARNPPNMSPETWDRDLPALKLKKVDFQWNSLSEGWNELAHHYLLRSVLVLEDREVEQFPFRFVCRSCRVRDLYDELAEHYQLNWSQDEKTGITWLYPRNRSYLELLPQKIRIQDDQFGLPMRSGVIQALYESPDIEIDIYPWSSLFVNTFDYPVDVPAGDYTLRDLLNLSASANPTKTFFLQPGYAGVQVTELNMTRDEAGPVPLGAAHLWDLNIGKWSRRQVPDEEEIVQVLGSVDPSIRHAAKSYLEVLLWGLEIDELPTLSRNPEVRLWTSLAILSIMVRSESATHLSSLNTIKELATSEFLGKCDLRLAVLIGLEMILLDQDGTVLQSIRGRVASSKLLEEIRPMVGFIMGISPQVRKTVTAMLQDQNSGEIDQFLAETLDMVGDGRLRFEVLVEE